MSYEFPLYPLRSYERVFTEGNYKCIQTAKNRYVLDYVSSNTVSYTGRRIRLLSDRSKPYRLYPVSTKIESIIQMLGIKSRTFYTDRGKIVKWKKDKYYKIVPYIVKASWVNAKGQQEIFVKGISQPIQTSNYKGEKYAKLVDFGKQKLFYGFTNDKEELPKRIKI